MVGERRGWGMVGCRVVRGVVRGCGGCGCGGCGGRLLLLLVVLVRGRRCGCRQSHRVVVVVRRVRRRRVRPRGRRVGGEGVLHLHQAAGPGDAQDPTIQYKLLYVFTEIVCLLTSNTSM